MANDAQLLVVAPASGNHAPLGHYMLLLLNDLGVPSEARLVQVVPMLGDLNDDGIVGIIDLLMLLGSWGQFPPQGDCLADLTGDGTVGILDLLTLLSNWG